MDKEVWKSVNEFEGLYEVSNLGNVRTVERYVNARHRGFVGKRLLKQKVLLPHYEEMIGYLTVALYNGKNYSTKFIHRLVAQAFIPNPNNLPCVNHKDENKLNNCVDNLEWCDYSYNANYGSRNERISNSRKGMKFSDEHRKNIGISAKNRVTDEFRDKMRKVHLGKKLSEEHKKKISEGVKRAKQKSKVI